MFWPSGSDPAKLEITDKERSLLDEIKAHLVKKHLSPTLDSYLATIHDFQSSTNSLVSKTILRERVLNSSTQWANTQELRHLLLNIRDRVCKLTATHYRTPVSSQGLNKLDMVYEFFDYISDLNSGSTSLFTTNYDILPEHLFSNNLFFTQFRKGDEQQLSGITSPFILQNGFPAFDNTDITPQVQKDSSPRPNRPVLDPRSRETTHSNPRIDVYRLHGCVAWTRGEIGDRNIYFDLTPPAKAPHFAERLCVSYPGHEEEFGRIPHCEAFHQLSEQSTTARAIIFVGFSFRDAEVAAVIGRSCKEAMRTRKSIPKLIVVDLQLTKKEVRSRIQNSALRTAGPGLDSELGTLEVINASFPSEGLVARIKRSLEEEA